MILLDSLTRILHGCIQKKDLLLGRQVHSIILENELEHNDTLACGLIRMFAACGSLHEALYVYNALHKHNVYAWTAIILAHVQNGQDKEAIILYKQMQESNVRPNSYTYVAVLKVCANTAAPDEGKMIHADMIKRGLQPDLCLGSILVDMYSKCGSPEDAWKVFNIWPVRNVVVWNSMIAGYAQNGLGQAALQLFERMQDEGTGPNEVTFVCILKACSSIAALDLGKLIHTKVIKKGLESNLVIGNTLVDMYAKCRSLKSACKTFDQLLIRSTGSWNAMISGHSEHGYVQESLQLFKMMQEEGIIPNKVSFLCVLKACFSIAYLNQGKLLHADIVRQGHERDLSIGNALVDMYANCGSLEDACRVFNKLVVRNVVSWSAIIAGYAEQGLGQEALQLSDRMQQEGMEPNKVTCLCILKACSSIAALDQGKFIHADITKQGFETDLVVASTLVNMYAECGSLEDACRVFDELLVRDVVVWNAMVARFADYGHFSKAQKCFHMMQREGIKPDSATLLCLLLACSHSGLVLEGYHYFVSMRENYGLTPTIKHYVCIVDILGRAGCLDKAEDLVLKMPFQPVSLVWMTLLGSCAKYGNLELGCRAFTCLVKSDCRNPAMYVLMSNIYLANYMWEDAHRIQEVFKQEIMEAG